MQTSTKILGGVGLACLVSACAVGVQPRAKAAQVAQTQCADSRTSQDDIRLLQTTTVLSAQPVYTHVHTNTNEEERVSGAKLLIRPPDGVSSERLAGILQCHSARVLLGQVDMSRFADDPTWLPDAWVDIDVKPEGGNFAVTLSSDTVAKNLQVLERATAFADAHHNAATQ
jgi:hypothetical protein